MLSIPHNELLLERLGRHGPITRSARAALCQIPFSCRQWEAGDYLAREADRPSACAMLLSGFAFRQKLTGNGNRQIVAISLPGEVVDLQNLYLDFADHSVQMLTDGNVLTFPRKALQAIAEVEPAVAKAILLETLIEASILREWVTNIGRRNAKTRIAHLICEFAARLEITSPNGATTFDLPMTQEQIGDALGLTAVHVNRKLGELAKAGLVTWTKQSIQTPDIGGLRLAGDFNGRYLHRTQVRSDER